MNDVEIEFAEEARPRTVTVLVLLSVTALVLSYLGAYALAGALHNAELLTWNPGDDPRPRWFITGFLGLSSGFALIGGAFRLLSWRQLRRIDSMADEN